MSATGGTEVQVRELNLTDLDAVARLHLIAFPDSALGSLGEEALTRYYQWLLGGTHDASALAAVRSGQMVGYLVGGVFNGSTIGFVQTQRWFLARRVLRQPMVLARESGRHAIALALRLLARRLVGAEPEQPWRVPPGSFGVLAVAVDPTLRRQGVGAALLGEAELVAAAAGFSAAHLSVDPANTAARDFYLGLGWEPLGLPGDSRHGQLLGKTLRPAST